MCAVVRLAKASPWVHFADILMAVDEPRERVLEALDELVCNRLLVTCQPSAGVVWYITAPGVQAGTVEVLMSEGGAPL